MLISFWKKERYGTYQGPNYTEAIEAIALVPLPMALVP